MLVVYSQEENPNGVIPTLGTKTWKTSNVTLICVNIQVQGSTPLYTEPNLALGGDSLDAQNDLMSNLKKPCKPSPPLAIQAI